MAFENHIDRNLKKKRAVIKKINKILHMAFLCNTSLIFPKNVQSIHLHNFYVLYIKRVTFMYIQPTRSYYGFKERNNRHRNFSCLLYKQIIKIFFPLNKNSIHSVRFDQWKWPGVVIEMDKQISFKCSCFNCEG